MPTRPGTGVACSLGARRAPNLNRLNLNYTWGPPIGALWGTAAPPEPPRFGGGIRGARGGVVLDLHGHFPTILDLWTRASSMWLLGEFGILLFCSPGFWDVGGLLRALSSPGG